MRILVIQNYEAKSSKSTRGSERIDGYKSESNEFY